MKEYSPKTSTKACKTLVNKIYNTSKQKQIEVKNDVDETTVDETGVDKLGC